MYAININLLIDMYMYYFMVEKNLKINFNLFTSGYTK